MKHLGDITKINGAAVEPVEVIIGGSPCQDLSVAGKREGLSGERSGLFMEQIRIIKEMRERDRQNGATYIRPRYMVWENVPGAFSSNKGEDFRIVLEETARVVESIAVIPRPEKGKWTNAGAIVGDGWSIAWRVFDAQFWGVPQRRRRIALVADFGGATAPEILFERKGMFGDITQSATPWKDFAAAIAKRFGGANQAERESGKVVVFNGESVTSPINKSNPKSGDPCHTLNATGAGRCYCLQGNGIDRADTAGCNGKGWREDKCYTLNTIDRPAVYDYDRRHDKCQGVEVAPTVTAKYGTGGGNTPLVYDARGNGEGEIAPTITGDHQNRVTDYTALCCGNGQANQLKLSEKAGTLNRMHDQQAIITLDRAAFNQGENAQYDFKVDDEGVNSTIVSKGLSAICYGICSYDSNAMKSNNPNSGIYEAETTRTLDGNGGNPSCNQGGMAVVQGADMYNGSLTGDIAATLNATSGDSPTHSGPSVVCLEGNGSRPSHKGDGYAESDTMYTLNSTEHHAVCVENHPADSRVKIKEYGVVQTLSSRMGTCGGNVQMVMEEPYNATTGSFMRAGNSGIAETSAARDYKDPQIVCNSVVRRLTPLECERLQGFPAVRKVEFTKMTKDEYIAFNINEGNIIVDAEKGKVYGTRGPGGKKLSEPKELTGTILNGYRVVSIRNGQTKLQCRVHRIVWISKNGIIPDGYVVDHINNNKQDNRISNLQILTPKENSTKARKDGLYKTHEEAGKAKITNDVHDLIQYVYGNSDMSLRQLAEAFKISKSRISQIIHESGWTDIGDYTDTNGKNRKTSDSARYKALGNSIALPSWAWLLERLNRYCNEHTMASLFDGIGGFPLIWETLNGKGSCLWASEIEEFPIAVAKYHFGEE